MELQTILYLSEETQPSNVVYKSCLEKIRDDGFFNVLKQEKGNNGSLTPENSYILLHKRLAQLASNPKGLGVALSIMAQVNIAGRILKSCSTNSKAQTLLEEIIAGKTIVSAAITEQGWKGKLSNIKTKLEPANGGYTVTGEKSFVTNGPLSDTFLVLVRGVDNKLKVAIVPKTSGVTIEAFEAPFAKEATHCKLQFHSAFISEDSILDFPYEAMGKHLRIGELLSLNAIFCGYAKQLICKILSNPQFAEMLSTNKNYKTTFLDVHVLLDLLENKVNILSELRDKEENELLFSRFPFGVETISSIVFSKLEGLIGKENFDSISQDKLLFQWKDLMIEIWTQKAASDFIKHNS